MCVRVYRSTVTKASPLATRDLEICVCLLRNVLISDVNKAFIAFLCNIHFKCKRRFDSAAN